jgi:hypothetical protein
MYVCTKAKGIASAFPDTCKTPAGPSVVPVPYTNIAQMNMANAKTSAKKVFIDGANALTIKTKIPQTKMNEPGTAGGVVSNKNMGSAGFTKGSTVLFIEGAAAVHMSSPTKQNGNPQNAVGSVISPSQTKFTVMR